VRLVGNNYVWLANKGTCMTDTPTLWQHTHTLFLSSNSLFSLSLTHTHTHARTHTHSLTHTQCSHVDHSVSPRGKTFSSYFLVFRLFSLISLEFRVTWNLLLELSLQVSLVIRDRYVSTILDCESWVQCLKVNFWLDNSHFDYFW
jgi:hypothetical protein